ncbi:uncharacterized protein LOC126907511 isoform X1 [Daktulosphaira vitifoliae]|uniref:uncharacterized protein LOC126907511 isoform X1 n=1 Tax=Daktulosphaira vitifoliae TaxID=58002 RepID=UPI0021AAA93E|nr:uncharacterized protein LOC126907511 isoform X1 [Daktulosphaira vitifoliae]
MITIRHFICVIVYTKFSISLDPLELHCNFSKHLFNYFKHSEKYLYNFENNISELELRNYGTAVQSHGEIVMIMLDSLQEMDEEYIASDIMTINLYLNNVSGSINMIAKDKNGEFSRSESSQNLLEGYKIIHRSIVERLEYFLNGNCLNITVQKYFISLSNFKEPFKYSPNVLLKELEKLNSRIISSMNEYLTLRDMFVGTDNNILKKYCKIIKHLAKSFERKSFYFFNPKNVLFYDFMENRSCFSELDLISGSQSRQYVRYNSDNQLNDVLDMIRYAPLKIKNNNIYEIKLLDIFRFIKFDFDLKNILLFKKLLNTATVRPIMVMVHFYFVLVRKYVLNSKFKNDELKYAMKYKIIEMGQNIVEIIKSFMDMDLFGKYLTIYILRNFNKTYELISLFSNHNDLFSTKEMQSISKFFKDYMKTHYMKINRLSKSIDQLQIENVIEIDIEDFFDLVIVEINKITLLVSELKKYQYCFVAANKYIHIEFIDMHTFKIIFKHKIPFEQLGNYEDIYRPLYFPGVNATKIKRHNSDQSSDENDEINNDDNVFDNETQSYYTPIYLVDYLLYQ